MREDNQPAKSLQDIKEHAKRLCEEHGGKHMENLNLAARAAGFQRWNHAVNVLGAEGPSRPVVSVKCIFKWYPTRSHYFWERVGHLQIQATPLLGFSEEALQRIVFEMPEFWTGSESSGDLKEHFRIDSAYFHRVTSAGYAKDSKRTRRNVISFHLVENQWHATIFDYGTKLNQKEMEREIEGAITAHIQKFASDYQCNVLGAFRVLPKDLHEDMVRICGPAAQQYAASFSL
ncbi:hypothetical protein PS619_00522 [Pseudomonas fluorescens]|nr:hypothetical protein PS619_00522 [Pseudomonas fluorescens]